VAQLPYVLCYLALAVFVCAVVLRCITWSRLPMHVRWELYPVPHEPADKFRHGGSFMEESEWWKRPREVSRLGELKVMLAEILLLAAVKEHNRKLWSRTYPFHLGLYLAAGSVGLALLIGACRVVAPELLLGGAGKVAQSLVVVVGVSGLVLGILGALGLLHRRLADPAVRAYTVPSDIFNLIFFVTAFGCGLVTFVAVDSDAERALAFATNLVSFDLVPLDGTGLEVILPTVSVGLLSLLIAYIPLTHMSHFVGKYFAYHSIRWNDEPNLVGGPQEPKIRKLLGYKVSWAADHIRGDGKKTWLDLACENSAKDES
jgi:nitrate reductase gamma subunit